MSGNNGRFLTLWVSKNLSGFVFEYRIHPNCIPTVHLKETGRQHDLCGMAGGASFPDVTRLAG